MPLIQLTDYNTIQSTVQSVLGNGTDDFGYGQSLTSSQISAGSVISATQWINLRSDLLRARQHQTGADESASIPIAVSGATIASTIYSSCASVASLIVANRLAVPPSTEATLETITSSTRTLPWNGTLQQVITITWPSTDAARHFFNTGSNIQFTASRSGGNSGSKNNTWTTMLSGMGTITFAYSGTTASGSGTGSSYGWSNLPSSTTQLFHKPAPAGVYAENDFYIYGRKVSASQLEFTLEFRDDDTGDQQPDPTGYNQPGPAVDENVDGTLEGICQVRRASGSNVSVPAPGATSSQL